MAAALILIAFTAVVFAYYRGYIKFWQALPLVLAVTLVSMAVDAKADVRQSYGGLQNCYHWRMQEYRYGALFGADLWHSNQKVYWCHQVYHANKFQAGSVRRTYSHWQSTLWDFGGYDRIRARHLHKPNRWAFTVWASFLGRTAYWLVEEHNYPKILMVVYPDGHTRRSVTCGC